jgi:hypothetical protein
VRALLEDERASSLAERTSLKEQLQQVNDKNDSYKV